MNPPNGVVFNYYLKDATDTSVVYITIFDSRHNKIKTFSKDAKEKEDKLDFKEGMNEFVYNMLYEPAEKIEGMVLWERLSRGVKSAARGIQRPFQVWE